MRTATCARRRSGRLPGNGTQRSQSSQRIPRGVLCGLRSRAFEPPAVLASAAMARVTGSAAYSARRATRTRERLDGKHLGLDIQREAAPRATGVIARPTAGRLDRLDAEPPPSKPGYAPTVYAEPQSPQSERALRVGRPPTLSCVVLRALRPLRSIVVLRSRGAVRSRASRPRASASRLRRRSTAPARASASGSTPSRRRRSRSTISSVAGRPRLSSQKITFDRPDIGPTSISCSPPDQARRHRRVDRVHQRAVALPERLDDRGGVDAGRGAERVGADHRIVRRDAHVAGVARPPAQ